MTDVSTAVIDAQAAASNNVSGTQQPIELVSNDWRDAARRLQLNTDSVTPHDDKLRPTHPAYVGPYQVNANGYVKVTLPADTRTIEIYNETGQTIRRSYTDVATSGCGSMPILTGEGRSEDKYCDHVYIWSPVSAGINDDSDNGITVEAGV